MKRKQRKDLQQKLKRLGIQKELAESHHRYWEGKNPAKANALSRGIKAIENDIAETRRQLDFR
jgi:hypothetical protein